MRENRSLIHIIITTKVQNDQQHSHLDQLLHPIHNEDEPILIVIADVPGPHPARLVKGLLVGGLVVAGDANDDKNDDYNRDLYPSIHPSPRRTISPRSPTPSVWRFENIKCFDLWSSGWSRIIMALAMFLIIMVKTILRVTVEEKPRRCWCPGSESCNWIHCQQKSLFQMGRGGWGGVGANGFKTIITIFVNVIRVNSIKIISKWYHNAWNWVKAGWPILSWFRHKLGWYRNNHLGKLNRKSQAGEQIP